MTRWLILLALGLGPAVAPPASSPAEETFARIKNMAGTWSAQSTKGWTEDLRFQVIASGSAVLETSFDAHPGETMATLFYMDGPRLMLTHYCVAKNQPRLMATSFEDGNRTVTFTFVDATNLPTRDHGHMDKVVYHFTDDDHTSSQWTWYQDRRKRSGSGCDDCRDVSASEVRWPDRHSKDPDLGQWRSGTRTGLIT